MCFILGYKAAIESAKEYAKTKGPGTQAKPEQHMFFRAQCHKTSYGRNFRNKLEGLTLGL